MCACMCACVCVGGLDGALISTLFREEIKQAKHQWVVLSKTKQVFNGFKRRDYRDGELQMLG